ncbi:MAG: RNA polymerase sigma factor [Elusimicrobiota bacterium]
MDTTFEEILEKYQASIMSFIYRYVGNLSDADDLTQEVFISVYKNLDKLRDKDKAKSWIFSIAANKSKNFLRRKKIMSFLSLDDSNSREEGLKLEDVLDSKEESRQKVLEREEEIKNILSSLPNRQKEILLLRGEGFDVKEIAELLDISEGTVKANLHFARQKAGKTAEEL